MLKRNPMKLFSTSLLLMGCIFLLFASSAGAATVVKHDLPTLLANSDTVVVAEVTNTESKLEEDGRVYTTISFRTDEVLKGRAGKAFSIRQVGGRAGDLATRAPGMPEFTVNERVFLFLDNFDEHPIVTGLSQGKFQIAVGPDEKTEFVIPQLAGLHLVQPEDLPPRANRGSDASDDTKSPSLEAKPPRVNVKDHAQVFRQIHEFNTFRQQVIEVIEDQREASE